MPGDNLKLADDFAKDYDNSILKHHWNGSAVIFNVTKNLVDPNSNILDLGIGTGESAVNFQKDGHSITGLDGSQKMLFECKNKGIASKLVLHNIEELPFPLKDSKFDAVISNGVFHLIHPIEPIIPEIKRILNPDGIFAFTFENSANVSGYSKIAPGIWEMKSQSGVHTYKHSITYISAILVENAFEIKKQNEFLAYLNPELQKEFYFTLIVAKLK
jgi:ubiquinone/menaquinone biosynthesis C-methylase UbiE